MLLPITPGYGDVLRRMSRGQTLSTPGRKPARLADASTRRAAAFRVRTQPVVVTGIRFRTVIPFCDRLR